MNKKEEVMFYQIKTNFSENQKFKKFKLRQKL